ncbi:hypothetical protein FPQ18DRAFT_348077 [Pyronema domesticum]|nr:hypothetical protein FPQ18DRAFT_348077 [Pyronema domesticum]
MSTVPLPTGFPLPAVHRDLAPYIRSPSHTHQTRQLLSAHLASLTSQPRITSASGSTDEFTRFLDLELGRGDGVRRQYLTALRAHAQAQRDHAAAVTVLQAATADDSDDEDGGDSGEGQDEQAWKESYLRTLRIRRAHNRLLILREGVAALSSTVPERDLKSAYTSPAPEAPPSLTTTHQEVTTNSADSDALRLELEKRIVSVASSIGGSPLPKRQGTKMQALQAVLEELSSWLEKKLSIPEPAEAGDQNISGEQNISARILLAYREYLAARKELLMVVGDTDASPPPLEEEEDMRPLGRLDTTPPEAMPVVLRLLAAAEHLVPLVRSQKALLSAGNQFSGAVAKGRGRVADLLQDGGGLAMEDPVSKAREKGEESVRTMAVAEKQAQGFTEEARKKLEEARKTAEEVDTLCGKKERRSAIPTRGGKKEEEEPKGLWGGLGGNVGVIGDGI